MTFCVTWKPFAKSVACKDSAAPWPNFNKPSELFSHQSVHQWKNVAHTLRFHDFAFILRRALKPTYPKWMNYLFLAIMSCG